MIAEIDIYGVYLSSLLVFAIVAYVVHAAASYVLDRYGVYRLVWHRPLFDSALFVIVLGGVVAAAGPLRLFVEGMGQAGVQP